MTKNIIQRKTIQKNAIISFIILSHNDEDIIAERIHKINQVLQKERIGYEILVIDNGSGDNTSAIVKNIHTKIPNSRTIVLSKKYDPEIALTAGLDNAIGDYVILFNIYTDPPYLLHRLITQLESGYDIVIGKCKYAVKKPLTLSRLLLLIVSKVSSHDFYYHHQNYLYAINRKAANSVTKIRRKNRSFSYINYLIGFKKIYLEYKPISKFRYKITNDSFISLLFKIVDIVISNSFKPIRILSMLGVIFSLLYLLYVLFVVILAVFVDPKVAPQGWISLSTVTSVMFFLLFSLLALISEYIIRILNETRNEPLYFVSEEIDRSSILPKHKIVYNVVKS